ncbi:MAG: hypothetical protein OHK0046_51770 [Anaerolineae bacterium]
MWVDLTVNNAEGIRDFYQQVVGWQPSPVDMGDYQDYNMLGPDQQPAVGVCHKQGPNADQPSQWMIYITVDDLDQSLAAVEANGGKVLSPIRGGGGTRFAVIQDPAGAVCSLFEQSAAPDAE